jgi:hypothetical protein
MTSRPVGIITGKKVTGIPTHNDGKPLCLGRNTNQKCARIEPNWRFAKGFDFLLLKKWSGIVPHTLVQGV